MLNRSQRDSYSRDGFTIVRALFGQGDVSRLVDHYMRLRDQGFDTGEEIEHRLKHDDPLRRWPRLMHPHRRDLVSKAWLLDPRIREVLRSLMGDEPLAAQSMVYYKPPGSRGHALHQDQYFLRVDPETCVAAWIALDPADEENGGMRVVPGFGSLPLLCVEAADDTQSWSAITCPLPEEAKAIAITLAPGDALFFNGWVPHGSLPNRSQDRFRRNLIGHYVPAGSRHVSSWYLPLMDFDGNEVQREPSTQGGACGVWQEDEVGEHRVAMVDPVTRQPTLLHE
jgi:hypothetical protein